MAEFSHPPFVLRPPDLCRAGGITGIEAHDHGAAPSAHQSRKNSEQGSLAAAVWPEQAEEFGRANIKRNVVESCPALVAVHDVLHRDDGSSDGFRFSAYFRVCRGLGSHRLFYDEIRLSIIRTNSRGRYKTVA
jgi:hypothetical protein